MYQPLLEKLFKEKRKFAFLCTFAQFEQVDRLFTFKYKYNYKYDLLNVYSSYKEYIMDNYVKGLDELKYGAYYKGEPLHNYCLVSNEAYGYFRSAKIRYYSFQTCSKEALEHCGYEIIDINDVLFKEKEIIIERDSWSITKLYLKENNRVIKEIILNCQSQEYEYEQEALKCHSILKNFKTKYELGEKVKVLYSSSTEELLNNYGYNKEDDIQGTIHKITIDYVNKRVLYDVFLRVTYHEEIIENCAQDDLQEV